jgi:hypothetical protein
VQVMGDGQQLDSGEARAGWRKQSGHRQRRLGEAGAVEQR